MSKILRFDGITIYEMSEAQLNRVLIEHDRRLSKEDKKTINDLIAQKVGIARCEAKGKRQADPDFVKNNF